MVPEKWEVIESANWDGLVGGKVSKIKELKKVKKIQNS